MRLKRIEVLGFKSFADRQVVVVDDRVTGVIGPNGCGKSNIVDAMRWCMGEQSAKHLRGSGMADVIFAGCSTRGPASMAEVTLVFENSGQAFLPSAPGGGLPAPGGGHLDMPEIAITRRLFADGTSEYLINKVPSRLRDITELLAGTGVGTKGYSIIEQGQVGKIVSSKPEDRRHIIDEAAGITKFKAQRAAAERKIEQTQQNLLRVTDVLGELETRIVVLRRQAQKAERYKRYRSDLRDLELWAGVHRFLELHATGAVLEARRADLGQQLEDLRASIASREALTSARRLTLLEVERELGERQQAVYDVDNRIRLLEAEDDYRRRDRDAQLEAGAQARAEAEVAQRGLDHLEVELREVRGELDGLGDGSGDTGEQAAVARLESAWGRLESELAQEQSRFTAAQRELADRGAALAAAQARREALQEAATGLGARLEGLDRRSADVRRDASSRAEHVGAARGAVEGAKGSLATAISRRAELDRDRAALRERVAATEVELDTARAELHRCRSRLQSLEEIQARYRSCGSGVQVVMEHREEIGAEAAAADGLAVGGAGDSPRKVLGILADYLTAPQHLEAAVAAVLGERLEGVVVDEPGVGARGVELLKRAQEGRITFLPRRCAMPSPPTPSRGTSGFAEVVRESSPIEVVDLSASAEELVGEPGVVGRLADLVQVGGGLASLAKLLIGDVVVVDSLARALELWERSGGRRGFVTVDGDRIDASGVVVGGSPTALDSALLQQKREIRELQEILDELQAGFESTRARHLGFAQRLAEVETAREAGELELREHEKTVVGREGELQAAADAAERLRAEAEAIEREAAEVRADLAARHRDLRDLDGMLGDGRVRAVELRALVSGGEERIESLARERDALSQQLTDAKVALARWQQRSDALQATAERLTRQAEGERQRIHRLQETAVAASDRAVALDKEREAAHAERERLAEHSRQATLGVHDSRESFDSLRLEIDEIDASARALRGDLDERRERMQEVEIGLREIEMERAHLVRDVRERLDVELPSVVVDHHDRPLCGEPQQSRARELKGILSRMGEVNLMAIEEYDEVSKRFEFLSRQRGNLETAIAQLQEAIDRINKITRQLFRDTFAAVNEKFQHVFPRLFAGGRAELKLTDPDDPLQTGVEIVAQPPGKQLRSLDLLSGGEKALTAVSLVFAIFLIKPSPFCLLDEVDAPLDDVNVGRFCNLVHELAGQTQFVIITHNKVTMETADRLYGVTMEQRGVSKLVSVNIRRAIELAYD